MLQKCNTRLKLILF